MKLHKSPWVLVLVASAIAMIALTLTKVIFVGAVVFALFAVLYAAGAILTVRRRAAGPIMTLLPSLILIVAEGRILFTLGVRPAAYSPATDFLITVVGVPVALVCLIAAVLVLVQRPRGIRVATGH